MKLALVVAALAALPLVLADPNEDPHCSGWPGIEATGLTEVTMGDARAVYLDDRGYVTGNGLWLYVESNGVWVEKHAGVYRDALAAADLQRGGASDIIPDDSEVCSSAHPAGPDQLVF